jgi:protein SCO1/2
MLTRTISRTFSAVLGLLILSAVLASCARVPAAPPTPTIYSNVTTIDPPLKITDFELTNQTGQQMSRHELDGKLVLLSFGYTHCPDVCPITLARFKQIKGLLGDKSHNVTFLFISVDGARDTPARLSEYLTLFDTEFIGLTGEETAVRNVITEFGGIFNLNNAGGLRKDYTVDHTSASFLLGRDGKLSRKYAYASTPEEIVADISGQIG